ncbi:hypothetical protein BROUX41_004491 [Berkeleyomyces rouxiae]|uniref:uncharacterized protein n=1 Tax=Berkeleyomyces rouxiae TaxID=2035830 RepID=UPI003B76948A
MAFSFGNSSAPGSSSTPAPSAAPSLFGKTATASGGSDTFSFGKTATPSTPALGGSTPSFLSGGSTGGGNLFGGAKSTPSTTTSGTGGLFSAGATGSSTTSATPMFGAGAASSGGGFSGLATPAKPGGMFGLNSTTPAGAPPANKPTVSSSLSISSTAASSTPAAAPNTTSLFGAGATTASATSAPAASGGLFGAAKTATPSMGNLFGSKPADAATTTPAAAPTTTANLFGSKPADSTATTSAAPAATSTAPTSLFGAKPADAAPSLGTAGGLFGPKAPETTTPAAVAAPAKPALSFGSLAGATAAKPAISFGSLGGATPAATTSAPTTTSTTTTAAPTKSLFGAAAPATPATTTTTAPAITAAATTAPTTTAATATSALSAITGNGLGASTQGPSSQLPRLKNKSMDDIITRWASDLTKYQKDFKDQATKVAEWDRLLVDNGEKIQKLYLNTFEAERASNEIEKQLMAVESQQDELEAWLDKYEGEVKEMVSRQYGANDQLGGPDQERERTYKLAEKLSQTLDEKSRDLGKMVDEINDISSTLNKSSRPEDPVSQIVRVLNGHLGQLQWIDTHASALQAKIAATQKAGGNLGSQYGMSDNDAAESFYRSYMPRK